MADGILPGGGGVSGPPVQQWSEDRRVEWEERAAILEYDEGLTRNRAEWLAYNQVRGTDKSTPRPSSS